MTDYEKITAFWRRKNIQTDAELAEALNGYILEEQTVKTWAKQLPRWERRQTVE